MENLEPHGQVRQKYVCKEKNIHFLEFAVVFGVYVGDYFQLWI